MAASQCFGPWPRTEEKPLIQHICCATFNKGLGEACVSSNRAMVEGPVHSELLWKVPWSGQRVNQLVALECPTGSCLGSECAPSGYQEPEPFLKDSQAARVTAFLPQHSALEM